MKEIWKPIKGYEGKYEVSNFGRIKQLLWHQLHNPHIMKQSSIYKYNTIGLFWHKPHIKMLSVHRLIALAFIPIH